MYNCKNLDELSFFVSTDFETYKFIDSKFQNCSFFHNKTGCQITFEEDYGAYWIYFVNFLGTLAVLPGNIVSALLMDRIGRLTMLGMVSGKRAAPAVKREPVCHCTPCPLRDLYPTEVRGKSLKTFH